MKSFEHIEKMERIMDRQAEVLRDLNAALDAMESGNEDYNSLVNYYYSEQRDMDMEDDNKGLIPQNIKRGVLSEDAVYNLMSDYYETGIKMLEVATKVFKNR